MRKLIRLLLLAILALPLLAQGAVNTTTVYARTVPNTSGGTTLYLKWQSVDSGTGAVVCGRETTYDSQAGETPAQFRTRVLTSEKAVRDRCIADYQKGAVGGTDVSASVDMSQP